MLRPEFTSQFERDVKRLKKKHADLNLLKEVVRLVLRDDEDSRKQLLRRHRMHELSGDWRGAKECHIANLGDWLWVWKVTDGLAVFLRTGTHEQIFR